MSIMDVLSTSIKQSSNAILYAWNSYLLLVLRPFWAYYNLIRTAGWAGFQIGDLKAMDLYERITSKIVAAIEAGAAPWHQPWSAGHAAGRISRPLRHNGQPYSGINVLSLWAVAQAKGYTSPLWMTYKQAGALGGQIRKGEHGATVVYAGAITRSQANETGDEVERNIPFLKSYFVFNSEQIDGLPAHFSAIAEPALNPIERDRQAESFFAATGADIRHGGNRAFYAIDADRIQMPFFETFEAPTAYYAVLAHETVHWTRPESRLDRTFGRKRFGDEGYAMEELVAELGSAFICADLNLSPAPRDDHASYISAWLKVLKNDKRAIFTAASHAERAGAFLHGFGQENDFEKIAA